MKRSIWLPPSEPRAAHALFVLSYRNLLSRYLAQFLLPVVLAWASWDIAPRTTVIAWWAFMVGMACLFVTANLYFRKAARSNEPQVSALYWWPRAIPLLFAYAGVGYGCLGFLMVLGQHDHNLLLMVAFAGVLAFSATNNAASDPLGFVLSVVTSLSIIVTQFPKVFPQSSTAMTIITMIYVAVLVISAYNSRRGLLEAIELRITNEDLAKANAATALRAEQANRDKSEFFAAASHDLRQPVHALLLLVEAFRQKEPGMAEHPLIRSITSAGQSISSLFNSLMELSRLESGTERLSHTVFSLPELVERLMQRSKAEAERKGLSLRSVVSGRLRQVNLYTDKILLERVLSNLITNALRYTEQGKILVTMRPSGSGLTIDVHDTGIGIAAVDLGRIFDPYVQIGNHERDRSKGLGLGLAIVQQSVRLLSIDLSVRSQVGKGSRFRLRVPAKLISTTSPTNTLPKGIPAYALPHQSSTKLAGKKLLLVDDDPLVVSAMQALLASWQMNVRCATRADESVWQAMHDAWEPDCVLCDFRMPGDMDGVELLDMLLERYPRAVGILQTGELAQAVQRKAEDAGYLVLFKPVLPQVLGSTLEAVLTSRDSTKTGTRR